MRRRRLGRTNFEVSELVLGGGWVGGILIHQDDATKREAIRRALDGGINFIDTAPSYGDGRSETALGWLLKEVDNQPLLATKVRLDVTRMGDIAGQIERSLSASLRRLQRDSVDLLQLHNVIEAETGHDAISVGDVLGPGGAADGLDRMRDQGLTRHIGITALGAVASCRAVIDSGRFDTAQVYHNMLNPSAARAMPAAWTGHDLGGIIAACHAHDMGVMNIRVFAASVLAGDQLTGREVVITKDTTLAEDARKARAVFAALGDRYGNRAQTAVRFALANANIACVVIGLAELRHLDEALAAADMGPLPAEALAALDELYQTDFRAD